MVSKAVTYRKTICEIQERMYKEDSFDNEEDEEEVLPEPTISNLSFISKEILSPFTHKVNKICEYLLSDKGKFVKQLGDLLEEEEEKKDLEALSMIFNVFKNLLLIANQAVLEMLVTDEFYLITFGALQCNNMMYNV